MFKALREDAQQLRAGPPGGRFVARYRRHRTASRTARLTSAVLGAVILVVGLIAIPFPGPGWLLTALGVGLLGGESLKISRTLDWLERKVTAFLDRHYRTMSGTQKTVFWVAAIIFLAGTLSVGGYYAYRYRDSIPLI